MFVRFLHHKVSLYFSLSCSALQKEVTMCSPYIRSEELFSPIWGQSIYINYLEFFCMGDSSLLQHLFTSTWTLGYFFYTLGYNSILHYLFSTQIGIRTLWALGALPFASYAPLTCHFGLNVCVLPFPCHIHMLNPWSQTCWYLEMGIWAVIRVRWVHEDPLIMGLVSL